jgi:hypothetical protein
MSEGKFDPHRRLCPDGTCVGIIGPDGRCRVCGRSASGGKDEAAPAGFVAAAEDEDEDEDEHADGDGDAGGKEMRASGGTPAFDPNRKLCPDGDCIGVVGADGVCNVCGKKAE